MSRREEFCQSYHPVVDSLALPDRIALVYQPEACLAEHDGRSVWLLRRRCDGSPYILKLAREEGEDLEEEFRLLTQLYPALAGHVPLATDCFWEGETVYLVRSYLPGESLTRHIEKMGPCKEETCRQMGLQLAALVGQLHRQTPPIIHRDIKPDNIIVGPDGALGLIDFGIARRYKPHRENDTKIMGSSVTAAPEQYSYSQTDERTDLFALGITLIWMLTGSFDRDSLEGAPVSKELKRVLYKCTAFAPHDRYAWASALERDLSGQGSKTRRIGLWAAVLACVLGLMIGIAAGVGTAFLQREQTVVFSSLCLERAVRAQLERPQGEITYSDLKQVERLALMGDQVLEDPSSYQYYMGDMSGDTLHGDVSDLSLLASMPNLKEVWLCRQQITDLSPLEGLPLTTLVLCDNQIADLSPLASLTSLETLWLGGNPAEDLTPLAGLTRLRDLNLDGGPFQTQLAPLDSLEPLADLSLTRLSLGGRTVDDGDWSPLAQLRLLDELSLWAPPEEAVAVVVQRSWMPILNVGLLPCEDLSILAGCPVVDLRLHAGQVSLAGAEQLPNLRNLGLFRSEVTDLSPLGEARLLETFCFDGSSPISDFSVLGTLPRLHQVLVPQRLVEPVEQVYSGLVEALGS